MGWTTRFLVRHVSLQHIVFLKADTVNSVFISIVFVPMQESNSDEDEMRRQWEADKPLSERLKVNSLFLQWLFFIIIHHTHYEKSDWSRAFNQFTIACELDMINAISAADIAFIMSSSTSAWLLSPLECSQKQNGWMLRFCFWGWIMWKMYNKTIIEFGFRMISWIIKTSCLCYLPQPSADNTNLGFDN